MQKIVLAALTAATLLACRKSAEPPRPDPRPMVHPNLTGEWKAMQSAPATGGEWTVLAAQQSYVLKLQASDSSYSYSLHGEGKFWTRYYDGDAAPAHYDIRLIKPGDTLKLKLMLLNDEKSFLLYPTVRTPGTLALRFEKQ